MPEIQQKLFTEPKSLHSCALNGHEYECADDGYYKKDKDGEPDK